MYNQFKPESLGESLDPDFALTAAPGMNDSAMDVPTLYAPDMDVPTVDTPAMDAPTLDGPTMDIPTMDIPTLDTPAMDAPTLDGPAMDAPAMDFPTMDAPTLDGPAMDAPDMDFPTMDAPAMDTPAMDAPDMDFPTMDAPTLDAPDMDIPQIEAPSLDFPAIPTLDIQMEDSTFMNKVKQGGKWLYNTIFNYDTLIIILIIAFIILIITVYTIYKNRVLNIELKEKNKNIKKTIHQLFKDIYSFLKKIINKISYVLFGKNIITDTETEIYETEDEEKNESADDTLLNKIVKKEVFNISDNIFTFKEAEDVCKSFDSELASKEQLEMALENGANWCNYGWSKNGLALYPIQEGYYQKLKQSNSHKKNQCGYPGLNGGKLNPNLKLGVNCYGEKPTDNIVKNKECNISKKKKINSDDLFINKFNCSNDSEFV